MTIAVHISFSDTKNDIQHNFNYRCFTILAEKYPGHHFIFIFDKAFDQSLINQKNITPVLLSPQIKNRLLGHYWYNFKLPRLLNKYHADIFISNGINCSLGTNTKQCMILQDISFLQKENLFPRREVRYLKKYFKRFVAQANFIVITNNYLENKLATFFPGAKNKTFIAGQGLNDVNSITGFTELQNIKDKYAEGKEYFLSYITDVSAKNTMMLLKAFSAFKKRQLSNMQLVLSVSTTQKENPVKDFATYKYRDEVKIITAADEIPGTQITAAAYATIYLPSMEIVENEGILSIKNNVPLITLNNEFCKSLYNNAALYSNADEKDLAQNMMLIYKDENLRNELIHEGMAFTANYSWANTADNLWQALQATTEQ